MTRIEFPYAGSTLSFNVADEWLAQVVHPEPVAPASDLEDLVTQALENPIGTPPLAHLVEPGQRVAIIVDDYTRKTPVSLFLPQVLERLHAAGVAREDIRIVVAPGTHRLMTEEELAAKVGAEVVAQYEIVNVLSTDEDAMIYMGTSSNGIPAWVNRTVAEADVRIGLGMVTPHMDAGFSGGAKMILPGVCSSRTVDAFHTAGAFIPENPLGKAEAPLRLRLERFVGERVPLHFILNVTITLTGEVYRCVAGHPVKAHRVGVDHARQAFGVDVPRRYPVVVANCYPYDVDWWQSSKGIYCGDLVARDGGTLIVVTAAPEGNSTYPLVPAYVGRDTEELKQDIEAGEVKDPKQATAGVLVSRLRDRIRLSLVSDGLTEADAETMNIPYYKTVETAIAHAVGFLPSSQQPGSVAVIPQAGIVLPMLEESL